MVVMRASRLQPRLGIRIRQVPSASALFGHHAKLFLGSNQKMSMPDEIDGYLSLEELWPGEQAIPWGCRMMYKIEIKEVTCWKDIN
jgi:hypothetical protein